MNNQQRDLCEAIPSADMANEQTNKKNINSNKKNINSWFQSWKLTKSDIEVPEKIKKAVDDGKYYVDLNYQVSSGMETLLKSKKYQIAKISHYHYEHEQDTTRVAWSNEIVPKNYSCYIPTGIITPCKEE
jgi:hypothetical protein